MIEPGRSNGRASGAAHETDIAIVGMACLFPGAPDLQAFWRNLVGGVDAIGDPPEGTWDMEVLYEPGSDEPDRVYARRGGYLGALAEFDPLEHGIMPATIHGSEPDQWLVLRVARQAVADAGYDVQKLPHGERTAVILGRGNYPTRGAGNVLQYGAVIAQTLDLIRALHPEYTEDDLERLRRELKKSLPPMDADTVPGLIPNITAGRIANRLNLMGPSYTVDAACASSLIAADLGMTELRARRCDMALVGGVNVVAPQIRQVFSQLGALSRSERIRPFDRNADGTLLGEGVGIAVLKRLEDAEREGDRIYAILKGIGTSSDGRGQSVLAPRLEGEVLALRRAYEATGIDPRTIGLIEAHGTGTPVGDATEIAALDQVFGGQDGSRPRTALGSVKSMIGHLLPAAGIAGLIKAALAVYHKVLPPTINVENPSPALNPERSRFYLNTAARPWIHGFQDPPRRAGVNAFGFGGINAHAILEEFRVPDESRLPIHLLDRDTEVFILTADSRDALARRAERLREFVRHSPETPLRDIAYTLNVPFEPAPYRLALVASSSDDLVEKLGRALDRLADPKRHQIKDSRGIYFFEQGAADDGGLAFLFPGEGSQHPNLLADLCHHFPEVRQWFDEADRVFQENRPGVFLSELFFPYPTFGESRPNRDDDALWSLEGALPAVLVGDTAMLTLLSRFKIVPDAVVGHSSGEYVALLAAGMGDLADGALLGQFVAELFEVYQVAGNGDPLPPASLVAVAASSEKVGEILAEAGGDLHIAMDNCPHQTVVVGDPKAMERVVEAFRARGFIHERLPFDRPYHTPAFEPFSKPLQDFFARWILHSPRIRTYSCATAAPFPDDLDGIRRLATDQWTRPVAFRQTVEAMYADGIRIFVEVGPRGGLCAFVDDILRDRPHVTVAVDVPSRTGTAQLDHLVAILAAHGVAMDLERLYRQRSPRRVDLDAPAEPTPAKSRSTRVVLSSNWPRMALSAEAASRIRPNRTAATTAAAPADGGNGEPSGSAPAAAPAHPSSSRPAPANGPAAGHPAPAVNPGAAPAPPSVAAPPAPAAGGARGQVVAAHLRTMDQFLAVQRDVMSAFLVGAPGRIASAPVRGEAEPAPTGTEAPRRETAPAGPVAPASAPGAPTAAAAMPEPAVPAAVPAGDPAAAAAPSARATEAAEGADRDAPAAPEPEAETVAAAGGALPSMDELREHLLRVVSDRTGYPVEMLDLDLDLEADLGIDSIKRVEILGTLQQFAAGFQAEDMEALAARRTLREILDHIAELAAGSGAAAAPAAAVPQPGAEAAPPAPAPAAAGSTATRPPATGHLPLVDTVEAFRPGEELTAVRELTLERDLFLLHHTFGREVSDLDPGLLGVPIVPFTVTLELMAEAASLLVPGATLVGMRDVRGYRWITPEEDRLAVRVLARVAGEAGGREVHVRVVDAAPGGGKMPAPTTLAEGIAVFADAYPEPPAPEPTPLTDEQPFKWPPEELYEDLLFHGPAFRGLKSMDACGEDGARATIEVLDRSLLFRGPAPETLTDPILLDVMGQVLGMWAYNLLETDVYFPVHIEAVEFFGPPLPAGERLECRARTSVDRHQLTGDIEAIRSDGRVWVRCRRWTDRRFEMPTRIAEFTLAPKWRVLSDEFAVPPGAEALADARASRLPVDIFPSGFATAAGGIWLRTLTRAYLGRRERPLIPAEPAEWFAWLLRRMAAKDAVRLHLKARHDSHPCPADIELREREDGVFVATGPWPGGSDESVVVFVVENAGGAFAVAGALDGPAPDGAGATNRLLEAVEKLAPAN